MQSVSSTQNNLKINGLQCNEPITSRCNWQSFFDYLCVRISPLGCQNHSSVRIAKGPPLLNHPFKRVNTSEHCRRRDIRQLVAFLPSRCSRLPLPTARVSPAMSPPAPPAQLLFAWDFDKSLVLQDTDSLVFESLAPDLVKSHLHNRALVEARGWNPVLNSAFSLLSQRQHSPHAIVSAASHAYLPPPTARALHKVHTRPLASSAILSDSNSAFISACLARHSLSDHFEAGIFTNEGTVCGELFRVVPYTEHNGCPHHCDNCPSNLCKRDVLDNLIAALARPFRVVYVGDGFNDYCPAQSLRESDVVLCRAGYSLEAMCVRDGCAAGVHVWSDASELARLIDAILAGKL